ARQVPILWILHAGYFWLVVGYFLKGVGPRFGLMPSLATHAFTVGAMGVLIYGMVSRVALGQTGRQITASSGIVIGYCLINLAALIRVFWTMVSPGSYLASIMASGTLWIVAYSMLFVRFWPGLTRARVDG